MTEMKKKSRIDRTLSEMFLGILVFGIVCQFTIVWFVPKKFFFSIGLWIGIITACLYSYHLWWSLDRNLTINADNERGATAFSVRYSVIRYAMTALILAGLWLVGGNTAMLAGFLGVMGIKAGAYLQPVISHIKIRRWSE